MEILSNAFAGQRAQGDWKDREKFKCSDLELVRWANQKEQLAKEDVVKLIVLRAAVNSNRLIRWIVRRRSARLAKALDIIGP